MSALAARQLLHDLLDRLEAYRDRQKPPVIAAAGEFPDAEARDAYGAVLADAQQTGAVTLQFGVRELRHLVRRVALADADRLYQFLGRVPVDVGARALGERLRTLLPMLGSDAIAVLGALVDGWSCKCRPYGVPVEFEPAKAFLMALDAVLRRDPSDKRDLRTFSRQETGDSKLIEGQLGPLVTWLRASGRIPADLCAEQALAVYGLEKFAHPVLVSGPLQVRGLSVCRLDYVGLAPADLEVVGRLPAAQKVLTIENFASFNRHVHEVRAPGEVVVYSGGFPSRAVLRLLRHLTGSLRLPLWHWGDIDAGGVRIADYLARQVDGDLRLHLMMPELAQRHGQPVPPDPNLAALSSTSEVAALGRFLSGPYAAKLEQEEINPIPVP